MLTQAGLEPGLLEDNDHLRVPSLYPSPGHHLADERSVAWPSEMKKENSIPSHIPTATPEGNLQF